MLWPGRSLLLSAFHDDATDDHGWVKGRVHDVLVPALRTRHETVDHAAHYLTNVSIDFVSPKLAILRSGHPTAGHRANPGGRALHRHL